MGHHTAQFMGVIYNPTSHQSLGYYTITSGTKPAIRWTKSADPQTHDAVSESIAYTFAIEPIGNVPCTMGR